VDDIETLAAEIPYPCALKPIHSHLFAKQFSVKVLLAHDATELRAHLTTTLDLGLEMMVTEIVPGPDHAIWTYSTYITSDGEPAYGLTRNKLRSSPAHFGVNSYLVARRRPDVVEAGRAFLRGVGMRGMAHVEFKEDPRDGSLKLIECNHRFVNSQELIRRAGLDVAVFSYRRAVGHVPPPMDSWREGERLWFPLADFRAAREYRRAGELTWPRWAASLVNPRVRTPYMALDDPRPSIDHVLTKVRRRVRS
jgi:predicted ATP-grasp superfamily ATP-dependent carboligase